MTLVSPTQSNPGDTIEAADINDPVNQIAAVVNGNIDSTNISSVSGSKLQAGTVAASALDTNANVETRMSESVPNFVASGCVWSAVSGLNGTMTSGVVYINGKRVVVSSVASQTFVASRDTYVSVDVNGTVSIASAVTNNSASPSLPANSVWLAIVVTSGAAITSINLGLADAAAPVVSSRVLAVSDTNGALIYPRAGQRYIGFSRITSGWNTGATTTITDVTGLSVQVNIPVGRNIKIIGYFSNILNGSGVATDTVLSIREGSTVVENIYMTAPNGDRRPMGDVCAIIPASAGLHTYKLSTNNSVATNVLYDAAATYPAYIAVELA